MGVSRKHWVVWFVARSVVFRPALTVTVKLVPPLWVTVPAVAVKVAPAEVVTLMLYFVKSGVQLMFPGERFGKGKMVKVTFVRWLLRHPLTRLRVSTKKSPPELGWKVVAPEPPGKGVPPEFDENQSAVSFAPTLTESAGKAVCSQALRSPLLIGAAMETEEQLQTGEIVFSVFKQPVAVFEAVI